MSQVIDLHGNSAVFYIGNDRNLYEVVNDGAAKKLTSSGNYDCVSAGLNTHGYAMAYMQQGDGSGDLSRPWELDAWDAGRIMVVDQNTLYASFSAADKAERVYYLGWPDFSAREAYVVMHWTPWGVWTGFTPQQLGTATGYVGVSAGTDLNGNDTAYFVFSDNFSRHIYAWSESLHQMYYAQNAPGDVFQVVGALNGYFYWIDHGRGNHQLLEQIPTGDRFDIVLDTNVSAIMGMGTNSEGAMTVNYGRADGTDVQYDTEYHYYWNMGGHASGVVPGEGGYNYYLDGSVHLHEIDPYEADYVIASNVF
jgi:hypothetical protein